MSGRERHRERDRDRDRDGRDPEPKRRRSGFDQKPSSNNDTDNKRPKTEREQPDPDKDLTAKSDADVRDGLDLDPKPEEEDNNNNNKKKKMKESNSNGRVEERKDPTQIPSSRSYFQHDERGNARQVGRSFGRAAGSDRRWRDSKDDRTERTSGKESTYGSRRKDEKLHAGKDENGIWRHDGFYKIEAEQPPPVRKRPAFTEKKIAVESENTTSAASEPLRRSHSDQPVSASEAREGREANDPRLVDRSERPAVGDRRAVSRRGFSSRERYNVGGGGGGGNYRERDRFNGRQGYRPSSTRADKWRHDLFEEANKSPTNKNEEDQIAKVEELLAS